MKITTLEIPDIKLISPEVFEDDRGFFFQSFNQKMFDDFLGRKVFFVQENYSSSVRNVIRGLHYQVINPQEKLIQVIKGAIFDVAVDIRKESKTFGKYIGIELNEKNKRQLWIPKGFAHGFSVMSDYAEIQYKVTDYWAPEFEQAIIWNDPDVGIKWPNCAKPILSEKDRKAKPFKDAILS
jgi:dTDP-4-dehydrorhamnose 3,5-epimerase